MRACFNHADKYQAFRNASKLNGDSQRYFVVGQSAGGHLALALANKLVSLDRQGEVCGIAALVPIVAHPVHIPTEYVDKYRSFNDCANAPMNTAHAMNEFFGLFLFCEFCRVR
jgi:Esterase/lipase